MRSMSAAPFALGIMMASSPGGRLRRGLRGSGLSSALTRTKNCQFRWFFASIRFAARSRAEAFFCGRDQIFEVEDQRIGAAVVARANLRSESPGTNRRDLGLIPGSQAGPPNRDREAAELASPKKGFQSGRKELKTGRKETTITCLL